MSGLLNHSPADILRRLLIDLGLGDDPEGTGTTWPIYASSEPSLPDEAVTLYDTAGNYDGRSMEDGEIYEWHGVQVRVRGTNHPDAYQQANAISIALDQSIRRNVVTIDGDRYVIYSVSRRSGPISLGKEPDTNRVLFTINATVLVRLLT